MPKRWWAVVREALASARSQPVASVMSIVMVVGMCATVLLTTGRTVGALAGPALACQLFPALQAAGATA